MLKKPYNFSRKIRLGWVIEEFLILAEYFNLPKIMRNAEPPKNKLPIRNTKIFEAILKSRSPYENSEQKIYDEFRNLIDSI